MAQHVIVWEFRVVAGSEAEFIAKYGPKGVWAHFFGEAEAYKGTELVRDVVDPQRFLTLDYWRSEEDFNRFREQNQPEYERLDRECERLTIAETCLGTLSGQVMLGPSSCRMSLTGNAF